ncbi:efflux RND transporter periplasmic adaptor subunit [Herbaspirillum sp. YR522]|uniref:efflux RND transporter periplasmic adaptor subunit n=1 Tax=Herbaspirillum sp. YR522 TaxID=1144342 RepID=UPI00026F64E1|nr:efflux RND transporter periplasmic adaptor subunit [Herbaspirillum sp. YR522]EJN08274.1 RND family efflux transporter, MFP subunit [Herbaspirillum sp. YR522]
MNISQFRKPKVFIPVLVVIAIAGFVAIKLLAPPPPPVYLSAVATRSDIQDTVLASGTVKAYQQVSVGAQATGQVKSLKVKLGDTVKKGQLVAEIDSLNQVNALRSAEYALDNLRAQLRSKQATLKQAQLTLARQQQMLAGEASSRETFETAQTTLDTTRADIESLQAQIAGGRISVNSAQVTLGYTKITSPIDGQVVAVVTQEGQTVNANQSTPTIIKVARMDKVTIKAQISEADVVKVKPGQQVYFTILGDLDHRYQTTLRSIEPAPDSILQDDTTSSSVSSASTSASSTAIYYNGLLDLPNADGKLRISMTTQVNIVLAEARDAVVIPSTALGERAADGSYTVRVIDAQGMAQPRRVRIGINTNARVQIVEGLQAGEKVVIGDGAPAPSDSSQHHGPPPM